MNLQPMAAEGNAPVPADENEALYRLVGAFSLHRTCQKPGPLQRDHPRLLGVKKAMP